MTLLERLVVLAVGGCDLGEAEVAGRRALFDHLACLHAGRRVAPRGVQDAGAAAFLDRDDIHWPSLTHPGAIVWSVVRSLDAQHPDLWRAASAGYEVTARLARALGAEHRRYWHGTTTAGTVGGAVAAALILGVDPVDAAAHAASLAGGSIVCILERRGTRFLHRDHAVSTAVHCARTTHLGAAHDCLEHPRGMFAAMGGDPESLLAPAPASALAEVSFRRHSTSGFAQALVEAAGRLAPLNSPEDVLVQAPPETVALAGIAAPRNAEEAWWSCQHAVAVTLLGLDLEDAALVDDPLVIAQRDRISLEAGSISRVSVGGRVAECESAPPMSDRQLVEKWRQLNPEIRPPEELLG